MSVHSATTSPEDITPNLFEQGLVDKATEHATTIVLPEGGDDRILQAADELITKNVCSLIILGDEDTIRSREKDLGLDLSSVQIRNPKTDPQRDEFAKVLYDLRQSKGITLEEAEADVTTVSYFGTMLVHTGQADGMVSGAMHTTASTIRPALQIIKTSPGNSVVSSIFFMVMPGKLWVFGDCAVNPNPTSEQLADIAMASATTSEQFGIDPNVAMLSYSTGASGAGPDVDAVSLATDKVQERSSLAVAGPIQFDAASDPGVGEQKMPGNPVAGHANVFVFPDLNSGNITYKAVQRTAGALAVGPILQGLNKPINDLSRGATVADIVNTVAITAIQAHGKDSN